MELAKINGLAVLKMVCSLKWMDTSLNGIKIILLNDLLIFKVSMGTFFIFLLDGILKGKSI